MKKENINKIRVLHCPSSVGGNPQGLVQVERELGLDSSSIIFEQNYFQYEADEVLCTPSENRIKYEIKRWQLFKRSLADFDIIHFNYLRDAFYVELSFS